MKKGRNGAIVVIAAAVALVLCFILLRGSVVETVYPVERSVGFFKRRMLPWVTGFFMGARAEAENQQLRREVASLALMRTDVERLEKENARLRGLLGYAGRSNGKWLAAPVLSRGGGAAAVSGALRVGRGSLDGVGKGAVAVTPDGLVGIVDSVTMHTAEVATLRDPTVRVACVIETAGDPVRAVAVGGGDAVVLKYIESASEIPPRSRVLTSGRGGVFPPDIEIGSFIRVVTNENGTVYGEAIPAVDFNETEDVFIRHEK